MTGSVNVERTPPEDVFSLLGNETRVEILQALAENPEEPMSFSDLRERVGVRDSGKFNYHLGKLADHFVRHTDEGYRLSMAGMQVVGALIAGTYTADATLDPIEVDDPCPSCGETPILVRYEDEHAHITCSSCDEFFNRFAFPPGNLDQFDVDDLPETMDRWLRTTFHRVVSGFCPACSGRMDGEFVPNESEGEVPVRAQYTCVRCNDRAEASPTSVLFYHPGVMGFFYDHGVDVTQTPSWRVSAAEAEHDVELVSEDPYRVRATITMDEERLRATIEPDLSVSTVERIRE